MNNQFDVYIYLLMHIQTNERVGIFMRGLGKYFMCIAVYTILKYIMVMNTSEKRDFHNT